MVLRECGAEGRGLVARNALPRGTQLLQLPGSLLITQETALQGEAWLLLVALTLLLVLLLVLCLPWLIHGVQSLG